MCSSKVNDVETCFQPSSNGLGKASALKTPPPPPPEPSDDPGVNSIIPSVSEDLGALPESNNIDVFTLTPVAALKLLCGTIETLVRLTGDVPPTPPISSPSTPNLRIMQDEKEKFARHTKDGGDGGRSRPRTPQKTEGSEDVDAVPAKAKTPIGSPETGLTEPLHIIGSNMEPLNVQHGAIARKFYSKKPPPIALEEYLLRLHRYCPMSTAVYLATSLYIHRLAVLEKIIPVTTRNVHRLLLAGLRVAMKALEDLSYPHRRFAKVGGVSEVELGRLEVSFCFVTNFELKVDKEMLLQHAMSTRQGSSLSELPAGFQPKLPPAVTRSKSSTGGVLPIRDVKPTEPWLSDNHAHAGL